MSEYEQEQKDKPNLALKPIDFMLRLSFWCSYMAIELHNHPFSHVIAFILVALSNWH